MFIKNDEIRGYRDIAQGAEWCPNCVPENFEKEAGPDEIITENEVENADGVYYCDECKKPL